MEGVKLKKLRTIFPGKWTLIPLVLTLVLSGFQLVQEARGESVRFSSIDRFMLSNTFGILISILLEILKRWSTEDRVIKLTQHLDTHSPTFQMLVNLIEDVDFATKSAIDFDKTSNIGRNPFRDQISLLLIDWRRKLEPLRYARIETPHSDNGLSISLVGISMRVCAVSVPKTDSKYWQSPEGVRYWNAHKASPGMQRALSEPIPDEILEYGIFRIFVLDSFSDDDEILDVVRLIVQQVQAGVTVRIFVNRGQLSVFEGAIFDTVCVRATESKGLGDLVNVYRFMESDVSEKLQEFKTLWNASYPLISVDHRRESFSSEDVKTLLRTINLIDSLN